MFEVMEVGRGERDHLFLTPLLVVLYEKLERVFMGLDQIESAKHQA
jgi:hypothetical protein